MNLANWRIVAGDPPGAVAAYEDVLSGVLRNRGRDRPDVLNVRCLLAEARSQAGDHAGALQELAELHAAQVRTIGPDPS